MRREIFQIGIYKEGTSCNLELRVRGEELEIEGSRRAQGVLNFFLKII